MKTKQKSLLKNDDFRLVLILAAVYIVITVLNKTKIINAYLLQIIMFACVNIMITLALNLLTGFTNQFSIGQAGFMAIGAYTAAMITKNVIVGSEMGVFPQEIIFLLSLMLGGIFAALIAFLIGFPIFRLKGDYLAIVTLAFNEVIRSLIRIIEPIGGARGLSGIPKLSNLTWIFVFLILTVLAVKRFIRSSYGRSSRAVKDNEIAAEAMGNSPLKVKMIAFVYAAFITGVAGGVYAHVIRTLQPEMFASTKSVDFIVFMCAGGVGSLTGSILSAGFLTVLPEILRFLQDYRMAIYGVLLVIIMVRRPNGFFGGVEYGPLKWDNVVEERKGFFARLFKKKGQEVTGN